jgi:hypothetical protein
MKHGISERGKWENFAAFSPVVGVRKKWLREPMSAMKFTVRVTHGNFGWVLNVSGK